MPQLNVEENIKEYIQYTFDSSIPVIFESYNCRKLAFSDGYLYIIGHSNDEIEVTNYDDINERYRLISPTHFIKYERIDLNDN